MRGPVALLTVAGLAGAVACASQPTHAPPAEWTEAGTADVTFDVPDGWEPQPNDTDGFAAGLWLSPPADDGTRLGIAIDVACTATADEDAEEALDRWLDGPQWRRHEVVSRAGAEVAGAASASRSVSRYVVALASNGRDAEVERHAVMAVRDGVAALLTVEGRTGDLPPDLAERARTSMRFDAATDERVAACEAAREAGAVGGDA